MTDFVAPIIEPIVKMGVGSFRGVVDTYFNAEIEIGNYSSVGGPLYVHGATEHPCISNPKFVSTYPFGDKFDLDYPKAFSRGKIVIGNDVWIGESVTLRSGVTIGDGSIIGARAVVFKDVLPYEVIIGNPAQTMRIRFSPSIIDSLLRIKWWNWPEEKILDNLELMKDVEKFVETYDS